jgi:MFS family permease
VALFGEAPARTFRSLRVPNYRRYFLGYAISVAGTWMQRIGQDWLVVHLTHNASALSLVLVLQFAPTLLLGIWGGTVVDRVDTRTLLIVTQLVQAILAAALAVIALTQFHSLLGIYAMTLLLGIVTIFDNPARQVFVGELVAPADLVNAITLAGAVNNVGRLAGPALAAGMIGLFGVGFTFLFNAVSFLAALAGLLRVDPASLRRVDPIPKAAGQLRAGFQYVLRDPALRATMVLVAFVSVFGQNFRVVLPILATSTFHGNAATYGWLTAALGLGAVSGGVASAGAAAPTQSRLRVACLAFCAVNVLAASMPELALAYGAMFLLGAANIVFNTLARSLLQLDCEPGMTGRVMGVYGIVFLGGTPIGAPIAGVLCQFAGARAALVAAGILSALPVVTGLCRAIRPRPAFSFDPEN